MEPMKLNKLNVDYQYVQFHEDERHVGEMLRKTSRFFCLNNRDRSYLGVIYWHGKLNQYCFYTADMAFFYAGELGEIKDFLDKINSKEMDNG